MRAIRNVLEFNFKVPQITHIFFLMSYSHCQQWQISWNRVV